MSFTVHHPAIPLSRYVELMWWKANVGLQPSRQRIYPDGSMTLVIHLERPTISFFMDQRLYTIRAPLVAGPYSRSFEIDPSLSTAVLGVVFRPGAARRFFPVAAHELHNIDVALSDLHPGEADRLLNEICSTTDESARFRIVECYLIRKLKDAKPIPPAVRYAAHQLSRAGNVSSVRRIQTDTGLSHTRFIQLFTEHVGLTPKLFCRVRRFHHVLGRMEKGLPVRWAELAADCGYFDQAHLIRDFHAFAGATPLECSRALLKSDTRSPAADLPS
jgi:AraC-like DNA-binding protein